jgi:hypothetical protein
MRVEKIGLATLYLWATAGRLRRGWIDQRR